MPQACPATLAETSFKGPKRFAMKVTGPGGISQSSGPSRPARTGGGEGFRIASPEEIAGTIAFLLSDEGSNITGAVISSDGGLSL